MAPDGTLWVTENGIGFLAAVSPRGQITQHRLAGPALAPILEPVHLAVASDGSVWFTCIDGLGRLTPDGKVSLLRRLYNLYGFADALLPGPAGSIWYSGGDYKTSVLVHVSASLSASPITVPRAGTAVVTGLAYGPDGSLWFTQPPSYGGGSGEVGYVDSKGRGKAWPLHVQADTVVGPIVRGPDGAFWFGESNAIARITPGGTISTYRAAGMKDINYLVSGPGNTLWFTALTDVGRITSAGAVTLWPLPGAQELGPLLYNSHLHGFLVADSKAAVLRWFPAGA